MTLDEALIVEIEACKWRLKRGTYINRTDIPLKLSEAIAELERLRGELPKLIDACLSPPSEERT